MSNTTPGTPQHTERRGRSFSCGHHTAYSLQVLHESDIAIRVSNLSKYYQIYSQPQDRLKQTLYPRLQRLAGKSPKQYYREFWALKDISFEIKKGETVGIIGRNGCGKSTLFQMICGTLTPTSGKIQTNGRMTNQIGYWQFHENSSGFTHVI